MRRKFTYRRPIPLKKVTNWHEKGVVALVAIGLMVCVAQWTGFLGALQGIGYVQAMNVARSGDGLGVLSDGMVLAVGEVDKANAHLSSCEILDPATGRWTMTGSLHHECAAPVVLRSRDDLYSIETSVKGYPKAIVERYDAKTATWTEYGGDAPSIDSTFVGLADGRILAICRRDLGYGNTKVSQIFDPVTGKWMKTGATSEPYWSLSAVLMRSGEVLTVGIKYDPTGSGVSKSACELFNPKTGVWRKTGSLSSPGTPTSGLVQLGSGEVLAVGISSAERYDPVTEKWSTMTPFGTWNATQAILLNDGRVLVLGDWGGSMVYDPVKDLWTAVAKAPAGSAMCAVGLPDGQVLLTGGRLSEPFDRFRKGEKLSPECAVFHPESGGWSRRLK